MTHFVDDRAIQAAAKLWHDWDFQSRPAHKHPWRLCTIDIEIRHCEKDKSIWPFVITVPKRIVIQRAAVDPLRPEYNTSFCCSWTCPIWNQMSASVNGRGGVCKMYRKHYGSSNRRRADTSQKP